MINHVVNFDRKSKVRLLTEYVHRMMHITCKLVGLKEVEKKMGVIVRENDFSISQSFPKYMKVCITE